MNSDLRSRRTNRRAARTGNCGRPRLQEAQEAAGEAQKRNHPSDGEGSYGGLRGCSRGTGGVKLGLSGMSCRGFSPTIQHLAYNV